MDEPRQRPHADTWSIAALAGIVLVLSAVAPSFIARYRIPLRAAAGIYLCFVTMLLITAAPGIPTVRQWLRHHLPDRKGPAILVVLWCVPYLLYALGAGDFGWLALAKLAATGAAIVLLYRAFPVRDLERFAWQDLAVAAWLIFVLLSHQLTRIWNVPVNLDFLARLFLVSVGAWSWVFVRRVPELGYDLSPSGTALRAAARNFLYFAIIALPAGLALHFTARNPRWVSAWAFLVSFLEIFLFVALLEELFFRGFLQTLISKNLGSVRAGQVLVSCIFGLFHILHAPFPNWRYVALATVAGWFYGSAFLKGRTLLASALTHAMVDTVWRTFLSKS